MVCKNCGKIVVEPQIGVNFGRKIVLWLGWGIHSKANWVGVIILEKIVLWLRLWSYQMIILCCGCSCGLFLEKNWVVVGVVVSYCTKIGLMLLLGCVIQSNCGCGCSLQVDCVVVVVDHFSF